jgi:outer membrane protein assembly factor BamC
MKFIFVATIISLLCLNLTACGIMGGVFPDKARDYQLSSELPPLKIPDEIANKGLEKQPADKPLVTATDTVAVIGEMVKANPSDTTNTAAVTEAVEQEKTQPLQVELVKLSNGENHLQINRPVAMSWRMVGEALTRKTIEITARDQAKAEFTVQYDPKATDFKDDSFWDEIAFVFADNLSQEKPYHIKLLALAQDKITEVVILDEQDKPVAENGGLSLLKFLATTLKASSAKE